jgi:hypothetical protein
MVYEIISESAVLKTSFRVIWFRSLLTSPALLILLYWVRIWSCDLSQCVCDVSESSWPELHEFIFSYNFWTDRDPRLPAFPDALMKLAEQGHLWDQPITLL